MVNFGLSAQTVPNHCVRLNMAINTRLTEALKLTHPVVLAPMAWRRVVVLRLQPPLPAD